MKRPFSESPHIVSGVCESLKTAAIYKSWILEQIKAQLGNNPFHRDGYSQSSMPIAPILLPGQAGKKEEYSDEKPVAAETEQSIPYKCGKSSESDSERIPLSLLQG